MKKKEKERMKSMFLLASYFKTIFFNLLFFKKNLIAFLGIEF